MDTNEIPDVGGRPTKHSKELVEKICLRLSSGESLRSICRDKKMPSISTVLLWNVENREGFSEHYTKAREAQATHLFDEILEIADDGTNDYVQKEIENGRMVETVNGEVVARSRLRVDTRKWYLSKVLPKVYGEKVDLTTNGKDLPVPIMGYVSINDGNKEDIANEQTSKMHPGGDECEQDDIDSLIPDSSSTK